MPGRGRPPRHSVDDLLDLAIEVIAERGLEGCTFKALAKRADTSTTAFTYWFGTRKNLITEVLERSYSRSLKSLEQVAAGDGDPVRRLYDFGLVDLQTGGANLDYARAFAEIVVAAPRHPEWLAALHRLDEPYRTRFELATERAQTMGSIDPELDAGTLWLTLCSAVNGLNMMRFAYPEEFGPETIEVEYRRIFEGLIGRSVDG